MQLAHLNSWKRKLNAECFEYLQNKLASENEKLTDNSTGYDVVRGQQLYTIIANWKP